MKYNFNEHINRIGTDCLKWDVIFEATGRRDLRALWVADMDFKTPPFVLKTISERLKQEVLGYTFPFDPYYNSIINWVGRRHGVELKKEQIHFVPGIVPGLHHAVTALTNKGDKILIQTPVYHPFHQVIDINERVKVESSLKIVDGRFEMDFDDLEQKLPGCKMMILCNPHNPGGTVWKTEELIRLAELCKKLGVLVVSDEIHADMTHPGYKHVPFCITCDAAKDNCITLMAPSKAFNMPGICTSYYYIFNDAIREKLYHFLDMADVAFGNIFAYDCLRACYTDEGEDWLNQMIDYTVGNIKVVEDFMAQHCPKIKPMKTEASFLVFLDCHDMPFATPAELNAFFLDKAKIFMNEGSMFGADGRMFMRLNTALPRQELIEALEAIKQAYDQL